MQPSTTYLYPTAPIVFVTLLAWIAASFLNRAPTPKFRGELSSSAFPMSCYLVPSLAYAGFSKFFSEAAATEGVSLYDVRACSEYGIPTIAFPFPHYIPTGTRANSSYGHKSAIPFSSQLESSQKSSLEVIREV